MTDDEKKYTRLTARLEVTTVKAIEALAKASGTTRHAALHAAIRKGAEMLTIDELRATLPAYRL